MNIYLIHTDKDYNVALKRVDFLMDAQVGTKDFDELEILSTLVESYETKHYSIDAPDPIEAIKFRIEQEGLMQKDLVVIFGNKSRVSEVLNKKRKLTLDMIRNLHENLNIPFENLLGEYRVQIP